MNPYSKHILLGCLVLALSSCASTTTTSTVRGDCLNADRKFDLVSVEDAHHAVVQSRPGPAYRLTFSRECARIGNHLDASIGFSNGIPTPIRTRQGYVWANQFNGTTMICGGGADRLTWRERSESLNFPPSQCSIRRVEKLR